MCNMNFASRYQNSCLSQCKDRCHITLYVQLFPTCTESEPTASQCLELKAWCSFWILSLLLYLTFSLGLRTLNFISRLPSQTLTFASSSNMAHPSGSGLWILWIPGSYFKLRNVMVKSSGLWSKETQVPVLTVCDSYLTYISKPVSSSKMKTIKVPII